jgi:HEPN domain-containing protein
LLFAFYPKSRRRAGRELALAADEPLWQDYQEGARGGGETSVSLLVHAVDDVRQQLARSFERNLAHGALAIAAFALHQVAETISKAVLVAFTAYLPKTHDLDELGRRCAWVAPVMGALVPHDAPDRKRLAALLRASYVDARYGIRFEVSDDDLKALSRYVCAFRVRAERVCQERLVELAAAASVMAVGNP